MIKLVLLSISFSLVILFLKNVDSDLTTLAIIASGIIVLFYGFEYVYTTFDFIRELVEKSNIDRNVYKVIYKITVIGYLTNFGCDIIEDIGIKSLSDKLLLCSKFAILTVSVPVFRAFIQFIEQFI